MKLLDGERGFGAFARAAIVYLPVALLIGFSLINFASVRLEQASPWSLGGYALHSNYDSFFFRFVRLYGIDSDGQQHRIKFKRLWIGEPISSRPVASNAEYLVSRVQLRRLNRTDPFEAFRVETWQYTFSSGAPHLSARLIAAHRVAAPP